MMRMVWSCQYFVQRKCNIIFSTCSRWPCSRLSLGQLWRHAATQWLGRRSYIWLPRHFPTFSISESGFRFTIWQLTLYCCQNTKCSPTIAFTPAFDQRSRFSTWRGKTQNQERYNLKRHLALEFFSILDVDKEPSLGGGGSIPSTLPISL